MKSNSPFFDLYGFSHGLKILFLLLLCLYDSWTSKEFQDVFSQFREVKESFENMNWIKNIQGILIFIAKPNDKDNFDKKHTEIIKNYLFLSDICFVKITLKYYMLITYFITLPKIFQVKKINPVLFNWRIVQMKCSYNIIENN